MPLGTLIRYVLGAAIALALLAIGFVWAFQQFHAYVFPSEPVTPSDFDLAGVEVADFVSEDGAVARAWFVPPGDGQPVILAFHGSHASIGGSLSNLVPLADAGIGVVMMTYRGADGLPGGSTELNFAADARALYDQLDTLLGEVIAPERRVAHGFSLGSAVAARLAADRDFAGVILQATTYRHCEDHAREYFGFPFCLLTWRDRYDVVDHVARIDAPILFLHGVDDQVFPIENMRRLMPVAPEGSRIVELPGAHGYLVQGGALDEIAAFATEVTAGR